MKLDFFNRTASEQALIIRETAARRGLNTVMVEKDFWVSWTLAVLFAHPEYSSQLVFKGGTSLSKVFGVIRRFSEDIDLSVSPAFVGVEEHYIEQANSKTKTEKRMKEWKMLASRARANGSCRSWNGSRVKYSASDLVALRGWNSK